MLKRRDVLQLAGGAAVSLLGAVRASAQTSAQDQNNAIQPFSSALVIEAARTLAAKPFAAVDADLPGPLSNLSYDAYVAIRAKPEGMIWAKDPGGFVLEPLHRGFVFTTPMQINLVEDGLSRRLTYDAGNFIFGGVNMSAPPTNLDFSGFRALHRGDDGTLSEIAIFQGASFFRSLAPGQNFGVTARGLSVRTGDPGGEEFPFFRAVWIEKPTRAGNVLVVHALLDSESLTGAYRFTLHPGDATIIDTECALFPRVDIENVGLATMSATNLFAPLDRRGVDDIRGAATEVSGLQMLTGAGEWVWRPVANRSKLQISEFVDQNPRGFGFLQRTRAFNAFNDDVQHWERRPSLWIEPIGDWGPGSIELLEIPSDAEPAQNMIAFWRLKKGLAKGQSAEFAYRQFWCWSPPTSPPLAVAIGARGGRGGAAKQRRFQVDFEADFLGDPVKANDIKANLTTNPGRIASVRLFPAPEQKRLRVLFDLDPNGETACELRLALDSQGAPASETWLYRWTS
ncbi:glucan biosynthesis protein D [Rhodoblastus sphagnicola]|uniref:Glucan biosynthesis protein D n=1 Tax=Rhodoblastus sphagnicola TaxID=333368 RepID=A0A2S6NCR3_9HYPH|nr:glucan biosynthesis protein D [Rhodoblastus sphagnicola]MBB4199414.1 glucans biosynthesis protein [Rhodoblastus sphagnicola]PPQ32389.1 glucan biosynthesis protein D [Rhodoblastus sphagnicola]